ncbi:hypothetical protein BTO05_07730 [Winogradskyella sp. PC-19]|uniref:DUF2975 domain-containing protein n=1 Tax=unclassified Winogradskyella TaxID=2615021 RepID=UPI000B3C5893|nr:MULTISPECIES: DUF2975 domain-containing protein [unclassified Winogradskyella]ARV09535.1 hypothetical protein BTO05_07730 [Winogradskyella sp. PC-19]RZN83729.1 MAG: DUF2975 domain-containing protein [Winogradskyella sp.]
MKDNTTTLTIITWAILLGAVSVLLNDIREFDFNQFEKFTNWAKTADKNASWFTSKNAIEWSYYTISAGIFFWRGYLIYGFSYFLSILKEVEAGNYFSDKNIKYFKKIGDIFISYTIGILILRFLLATIGESTFNFFNELKAEFTFLIPAGLAFYVLAEIFKRGKQVEEENELTI